MLDIRKNVQKHSKGLFGKNISLSKKNVLRNVWNNKNKILTKFAKSQAFYGAQVLEFGSGIVNIIIGMKINNDEKLTVKSSSINSVTVRQNVQTVFSFLSHEANRPKRSTFNICIKTYQQRPKLFKIMFPTYASESFGPKQTSFWRKVCSRSVAI